MAEVVVADEGNEAPAPVEQSAHEAAVAEGATSVQAAMASEAAEEAKAAAEVALSAAEANIENSASVIEAGEKADAAAHGAAVSAEMVHEAMLAQTRAIEALVEELKSSRKSASPVPADTSKRRKTNDTQPRGGNPRWVRR